MYTVQQLSRISHVSVRTLHYYDQIGLLSPCGRSEGGYRLYDQAQVIRLKRILYLKELDFSLAQIGQLMQGPLEPWMLAGQKQLLTLKKKRLERLLEKMDRLLKGEEPMNFDDFSTDALDGARDQYAREAQNRYGHTDEYTQSQKRTAACTKEQFAAIQDEARAIWRDFAALRDREDDDPALEACVLAWQEHITRWYYPCTMQILEGLGQLYAQDERFAQNMDAQAPGATQVMIRAIASYCAGRQQ